MLGPKYQSTKSDWPVQRGTLILLPLSFHKWLLKLLQNKKKSHKLIVLAIKSFALLFFLLPIFNKPSFSFIYFPHQIVNHFAHLHVLLRTMLLRDLTNREFPLEGILKLIEDSIHNVLKTKANNIQILKETNQYNLNQ